MLSRIPFALRVQFAKRLYSLRTAEVPARDGELLARRMPAVPGSSTARVPRLVVVGASAGGVAALRQLAAGLPADFPAPVLVVLHIGANESVLPQLIALDCKLSVAHAS